MYCRHSTTVHYSRTAQVETAGRRKCQCNIRAHGHQQARIYKDESQPHEPRLNVTTQQSWTQTNLIIRTRTCTRTQHIVRHENSVA